MTLNFNDFLQLSRISESLRRSDPQLARTLSAPMKNHRPLRTMTRCLTLSVCALLSLAGLVTGHPMISAVGGFSLMTVYPFVLIMTNERRGWRAHREAHPRQ